MKSSCQSKRRQSDYRYIWNQITLLVDESVPVLLLYNMVFAVIRRYSKAFHVVDLAPMMPKMYNASSSVNAIETFSCI